MQQDPQYPSNPPRMAPPTDVGQFHAPPRESTWPKVIGIISIVFGAIATFFAGMGLLSVLLMEQWSRMLGGEQQAIIEAQRTYRLWSVGANTLLVLAGILLIVAGVKLLRRRASAPRLCQAWAAFKMLLVLGNTVLGYYVAQEQVRMITEDPSLAPPGAPAGMMETFVLVGMLLGLAWGWALPVFMLIWFNRGKIKEETAQWS